MIDLNKVLEEDQEDLKSINSWIDEIYENNFAIYFQDQKELIERLNSKYHPIEDDELEKILTNIPLQLFDVSEELSKFKLDIEAIKLKTKQKESEFVKLSPEKTQGKKREDAELATTERKLLALAYNAIITRVESEINCTKELIMGAKKIWDARRRNEQVNPVGLVNNYGPNDYKGVR